MRERLDLSGLTVRQLRQLQRQTEARAAQIAAALLVATEGGKRQWRKPSTPWDRLLVARFGHRPSNRAINRLGGPGPKVLAALERGERLRPSTLRKLAAAVGIAEAQIRRAFNWS